jgi:hypothetical protein
VLGDQLEVAFGDIEEIEHLAFARPMRILTMAMGSRQ